MARKNKAEEAVSPALDIPILVKIGPHFLNKNDIRSAARFGKGTKLMLSSGDELIVNISYEKVQDIIS